MAESKVIQSKLIYNNPVLLEVSKFLYPDEIVNLAEVVREVDEKVEVIPTDVLMYSNCEDLPRLVKIPDLRRLYLDAGSDVKCKLDDLYKLRDLTELSINYRGNINLYAMTNMRSLRYLFVKEANISSPFQPMNLDTLLLENIYIDNDTLSSIANLELLTKLRLARVDIDSDDLPNVSFLSRLNNLTHLELEDMGTLQGGKDIGRLTGLTTLNLYGSKLPLYSALEKLNKLDRLVLTGTPEATLEWLYDKRQITYLSLEDFTIDDEIFSHIAELPLVRELFLSRAGMTRFLQMDNLVNVALLNCNGMTDYSELANCPKLKKIILDSDNIPVDILSHLTKLEVIGITSNEMSLYDYTPLINNKVIKTLNLNSVESTNEDMQILSTISNLENLLVISGFGDSFDDEGLFHLTKLTKLQSLNISYNELITNEGIAYLSRLPNLTELDISYCDNINEEIFSILATFPSLTKVTVSTFNQEDTESLREVNPNIVINMVGNLRPRDEEFVPQVEEAVLDVPVNVNYNYNSDDEEPAYPYQAAVPPREEKESYSETEEEALPRWVFEKK
jgi:hypothetical protein